MSKLLSDLLGNTDPLFRLKMQNLERASNNAGIDVRLTAEIIAKANQKMRELGLDPKDTTEVELYNSLVQLVNKHDDFLARKLDVSDPTDVEQVLTAARDFVQKLDMSKTVWAIKPASAKRLLKSPAPKKVMKQLGYRSVDSMLKRVPIAEIFAGIRLLESQSWQDNLHNRYKKLKSNDFETREVNVLTLSKAKWGEASEASVSQSRQNIMSLQEAGALVLLPMPLKNIKGLSITVLPLLIHYIGELRASSSYLKLAQMKPDFGNHLANAIDNHEIVNADLAGHDVRWRQVHRHFGSKQNHPDFFEPHIGHEDISWQRAEEVLYKIEPALHFWYDTDYVGINTDSGVISFNLMDMAVNYVNGLTFGNQVSRYMRNSLMDELMERYLHESALENQLVKQLDTGADDSADMEFALQGSF